ncbi:MAG: NAD-dependent protein deacylase [Ruminococcaceae bacterium]|jgi:NAD-dependent deacetylase|nr:NAD-dependent protein deacylase [Oscillospiraceae bacterium]
MTERIRNELRNRIRESEHMVFFGGAGMSTASGIPDFRGQEGLYTTSPEESPEYLLSDECLAREPERFFRYYREHVLYPDARPNPGHYALAELEERGILKAVVTQNIDGLHQAAGSRHVLELHGSVARSYCMKCGRRAEKDTIAETAGIPRCELCGGVVRPDVVLYGEFLPTAVFDEARQQIERADFLLVAGSSLTVNPAASLIWRFGRRRDGGKTLVIVNYDETPYDGEADYVIRESAAEVLPALVPERE